MGIINGKKIHLSDFLEEESIQARFLNLFSARKIPPEFLKEITWRHMILAAETKNAKIKVPDSELIQWLEKRIGKENLSPANYQSLLSNMHMPMADFEKYLRETIAIDILVKEINNSVQLFEKDIISAYQENNEKIKIKYKLFNPDDFKDKVISSDENLEKFFADHKDHYQEDVSRKVEYVFFDTNQITTDFTPTDKEIEDYYHKNQEKYVDEKQNSKTLDQVKEEVVQALKKQNIQGKLNQQVEEVYLLIYQTPDKFSEIVKQKNLEIKTAPYFSRYDFAVPGVDDPYAFIHDAFATTIGKISEPVSGEKGIYLIHVLDEQASYIPELAEVRIKVEKDYVDQEKNSLCLLSTNQYLEHIKSLPMEELNKELESYTLTDAFKRGESIKDLPDVPSIQEKAFELEVGKFGEVAQADEKYMVYQVTEKIPADMKDLETSREKISEQLKQEKSRNIFNDWYNTIYQKNSFADVDNAMKEIQKMSQK